MSENVPSDMCAQRRFRSACAFTQSDQNLHWSHFWNAELLHADKEKFDQTARARRLHVVVVGHTYQKARVLTLRLMNVGRREDRNDAICAV